MTEVIMEWEVAVTVIMGVAFFVTYQVAGLHGYTDMSAGLCALVVAALAGLAGTLVLLVYPWMKNKLTSRRE